jgi:hypothetical protein
MKKVFSICLLFLFFPSAFGQSLNKSNLVVLDLDKSFSKQEEVPLSKFLENIKFVPLETTAQSIIGRTPRYEVTDEYIIVRNYNTPKQILMFDRKTGKFIREIGKYGRGPDEYLRFSFIPYDPEKKVLYAVNSLRQLVEYDLSGKIVEIIKTPDYVGSGEVIQLSKHQMSFDIMMDNKVFIGYFINILGTENNKLALFTKDAVLKVFPNYQALKTMSHGVMGLMDDNHTFYRHDNKIYYLEVFSDTLFQLTSNSLIPRYYFKMGKYNVTWQINATVDHVKLGDYFYMRDINENNNYLFIKILFKRNLYVGFIDKKTNLITFCKLNGSGDSGFKDDLSGLMDVSPIDITENNEMIYVIQPIDLINWFKKNPKKAAEARKSFPWIKDIDEFSNPVIAIGRCKE